MRILMVQRSLSPPGGGNAVAAWMVHALAGPHEVATLTSAAWSPADTNAFYGTSIPPSIEQHVVPPPWSWLSGLGESRLTRLRMSSVLHHARRLAGRFDLLVTADNFATFPGRGIQYVHFPSRLRPEAEPGWGPLVDWYFAFSERLAGDSWSGATANITLANSQWTAQRIEDLGEVSKPIVLYPPVIDPGPGLPWADRDETFLCVGRFVETKRIETAISIVKHARADSSPGARLAIVGSIVDPHYAARLKTIATGEGAWIEFHENLTRPALNALMGRCRYGIQAMVDEHFGMATAEMTRAGCLVFAERGGGTPEVLNQEDALLWTDAEEAVRKVAAIGQAGAGRLQSRLVEHARQFAPDVFVERFRAIVASSR